VPIVYLHPVGLDGRFWDGVAVAGALTPDLPGFGDTPPAGSLSFAELVDFVAGLLPAGEPADIVGLSLGSMVAQHVAIRRPELVRSVVFACGSAAAGAEACLQRAEQTRDSGMEGVLVSTLERWFSPQALATEGHPGVAYARRRLLADDPATFAGYWEAMAEHDLTSSMETVRVPVTVIAATADAAVPVSVMADLADRIPGARLETIDGPHMVPLEDAAGFAALVTRHLERVAA
jgi:pimeloyl-ACP methyl ester carboxylesterase